MHRYLLSRNAEDYKAAPALAAAYFDNEPAIDSYAGTHFEAMVMLIETYQAKHCPISPLDPIRAILFRTRQQGLKPQDLEPRIGQRNRVYEVLNGKRKLTMAMVWRLHFGLGILAESLIRQPGSVRCVLNRLTQN